MTKTIPNKTISYADITYDEAMRRAQDLIPLLRENADAAERATRMLPEVETELHRAGLFRYHQPKAWGGMALDFIAYFDIPEMLARGDCSAAWNVANLSSHHRNVAHFCGKAQQEMWGENPDCLISSGIAYFQGRGRPVDGGIRLTGRWSFCSGVDISQWNMLACQVRENEGQGEKILDYRYCMVRREDYEIIDDWQTLGMCATGSRSVRCEDVFVPEHRTQSMWVAKPGHEFPGLGINTEPTFKVPASSLGGHCIAGAIVGNAQAALDATIDLVKSRSTSYTGAKMRDFQSVQLRIGAAGARIDAARAMLRNDCLMADALTQSGKPFDIELKVRNKRNCAAGVKLCIEAVDSLVELAGANGIYDNSPLQRRFRDTHAAAAHINFNLDVQLAPWATVTLGGEFKSPTM
jgi:3-hydroxy-9,10-secoandrosta-1,3,5(10)-triene-9,17-dione monooxygenase